MRLRRSSPAGAGVTRVRRGSGFAYLDQNGHAVDVATRDRIEALVIPPAWTDVWICPWPHGHIQAVGTDAAGRRQYRYHDEWRRQRDAHKHDHVLTMAARLPSARRAVTTGLRRTSLDRERVLAGCFRLLDVGSLRVGGEVYADSHETFGLATLRRDHVHVSGARIDLEFTGKSNKVHSSSLRDPALARLVGSLLARDDDGADLFAWETETGTWHDVRSSDVNDHLRELLGEESSAKDFRTWNATVLMAQLLALSGTTTASESRRRRTVSASYRQVADYLGNTPAVARASYVDPRVVDLFHDGVVVPSHVLPVRDAHLPVHARVESAVRRLLVPARRARAARPAA